MLEVISYRQLSYFSLLFATQNQDDDLARFIAVLKWVMAILKPEFAHKKPFNPVIGEHHLCWVENGDDDWTEFVSEQVSHHPPVSSFYIRNSKRQIQMEGNLKFGVIFGGNHAAVTTEGVVTITTPDDVYHLEKSLPNMMINNVVWGTKYVLWDGDFSITSDSGYSAVMHLSEVSPDHNKIKGRVSKDGQDIYKIFGQVGEQVGLIKADEVQSKEIERPTEKIFLYQADDCHADDISYPPPSAQVRMDSLSLWRKTSDAIIANDLATADLEKIKIETAQRVKEKARKEAGLPYDAQFFVNTTTDEESANWKFKNEIVLNREYLEKLKAQKQLEDEESSLSDDAQLEADASRCLLQ